MMFRTQIVHSQTETKKRLKNSLVQRPIFLIICVLLCCCSDDFLNGQTPVIRDAGTPLIICKPDMKTIVNLNIPAAGDQTYYIRTYPKWLEFDSLHGGFMDGKTSLTVTFRKPDEEPVSGNYTGELIIVIEDTGYFRIGVICGYPETD